MKFRGIAYVTFFVMMLLASTNNFAQNGEGGAFSTYTPYSFFGIGDILDQGISYNASMGGTGIADRNVRVLNLLNPAAVTARETKSFLFDFGLKNANTIFEGNAATAMAQEGTGDLKSATNTFNIHHIAASFPIYKNSAFKVGIQPYSSVGYNFIAHETDDEIVAEVGNINFQKYGQGTLYQVFLGAGATFWDKLSIGIDGQYYFGNIERSSAAYFNTNSAYRTINTGWSYIMSAFSAKIGLQYEHSVGKGSKVRVGATYNLGTDIKGYKTRYAYAETSLVTDTIVFEESKINGFRIPQEFGVAVGFSLNETWIFNLDYSFQDWTGITFEITPGVDFASAKASNLRFGMEYTPNRYDIRYYMKKVSYRAGLYHKNNYISFEGQQVKSTGITLGASFPILTTRFFNSVSFGVDIGQRGTMDHNLIRERYVIFNLSFDIHDRWFIKNMYN